MLRGVRRSQVLAPAMKIQPASGYDAIPADQRPFDWATPVPGLDGNKPGPWRVPNEDRCYALLAKYGQRDLYVEYTSMYGQHLALWVDLRDNSNSHTHGIRLQELATLMTADRLPVRMIRPRGYAHVTHLLLIDDVIYPT